MKKIVQKLILIFVMAIFACSNQGSVSISLDNEAFLIGLKGKYLAEINFGTYPQAKQVGKAAGFNAPIRWKVINVDEKNNTALVVSMYSLDHMKFYGDEKESSWKDSSIRKWLNNDFYNIAFNDEEKKQIKSTALNNKNVEGIRVRQGDDTTDKIFLLSADEFIKLALGDTYSFINTNYAEAKYKKDNSNKNLDETKNNYHFGRNKNKRSERSFWLRNNGIEDKYVMFVDFNKDIYAEDNSGKYIDYTGISGLENGLYVRPAMNIDISLVMDESKKYIENEDLVRLPNYSVGTYINFGKYYKNNNTELEQIEWRVIAKENDKMLLMSRYGIEYMPFNEVDKGITWETSTLRKWLNEDFYNLAFNDIEKKSIIKNLTKIDTGSGGNSGRDTYDYVTLLSHKDLIDYLDLYDLIDAKEDITKFDSLKCYHTRYAFENYNKKTGKKIRNEYLPKRWWLRDITATYKNVLIYDYQDKKVSETMNCTEKSVLVRPAIWVAIDKNKNDLESENNTSDDAKKTIPIHKDAKGVNVGKYYVSKSDEMEPIFWEILEKDEKNKKALLLSSRIIECATVSNIDKNMTWENSNIREFLNNEFIDKIFTDDEKEAILSTEVNNDEKYGIAENFKSTKDKLFIMSRDEIEKYFKSMNDRKIPVSRYVVEKYYDKIVDGSKKQFLRSSRFGKGYLDYIDKNSKFTNTYMNEDKYSDEPSYTMAGLRVAMWVKYNDSKLNTAKAAKGNYTDVFKDMIEKKISLDELPLSDELKNKINGDIYKFFGIYDDKYHTYKVNVHTGQKQIVIFELKQDDKRTYEDATCGDKGLKLREIRYKYDIDENKYISDLAHLYTDTFYDEDFKLKKNGILFIRENSLTIIEGLCQGQYYRDERLKFYEKDYGWCIDTNVFAMTEKLRNKIDLRYSILDKEIFKKAAESMHYTDNGIAGTINIEFELDYNDKTTKDLYDEGKMEVRFDYENKRYYYELKFKYTEDGYLDDITATLIKTKKFKKDYKSGYIYIVDDNDNIIEGENFNVEW